MEDPRTILQVNEGNEVDVNLVDRNVVEDNALDIRLELVSTNEDHLQDLADDLNLKQKNSR